jgi:hypothetical protein
MCVKCVMILKEVVVANVKTLNVNFHTHWWASLTVLAGIGAISADIFLGADYPVRNIVTLVVGFECWRHWESYVIKPLLPISKEAQTLFCLSPHCILKIVVILHFFPTISLPTYSYMNRNKAVKIFIIISMWTEVTSRCRDMSGVAHVKLLTQLTCAIRTTFHFHWRLALRVYEKDWTVSKQVLTDLIKVTFCSRKASVICSVLR